MFITDLESIVSQTIPMFIYTFPYFNQFKDELGNNLHTDISVKGQTYQSGNTAQTVQLHVKEVGYKQFINFNFKISDLKVLTDYQHMNPDSNVTLTLNINTMQNQV